MEDRDWFIPRNIYISEIEHREKKARDKFFRVKYCTSCRKAHETFWQDNRTFTNIYDDFVSIGLDRETCYKCLKS